MWVWTMCEKGNNEGILTINEKFSEVKYMDISYKCIVHIFSLTNLKKIGIYIGSGILRE